MRLVHFSDTHLGFRQFDRMTKGGINQREADVSRTFDHTINQTIALAPELVVIGGDIFHAVRAPNSAIVHAYAGFRRLRDALPNTVVVMVAGNHDTPRSSESGGILHLFRHLGITVVDGPAHAVDIPQLDACVLAVPDNHHERPALHPTGGRRWNILLLHGETGGISPEGSPALEREIPDEEMHHDAWDYIALGHYHVYRDVGARAFYSGAIDYTSTDAWGEHVEERARGLAGKGLVERDLATGVQTFHPLPRSRDFVDLAPIEARDLPAGDVNDAIAAAVDSIEGGIDGKVVRLKVLDLDQQTGRQLDHKKHREYKKRALQFQLVPKRPERVRAGMTIGVQGAVLRRAPVDELIADMLRNRALPPDLDRKDFLTLGTNYVAQAVAVEAKKVVVMPASEATLALARAASQMPDPYETGEVGEIPELTALFGAVA